MMLSLVRKTSKFLPHVAQSWHRPRIRAALLYWVLLPAAAVGSGRLFDQILPAWQSRGWMVTAGFLLIACGVSLVQKATLDLARYGNGTPAPQAPVERLVIAGSYAWCRHPMFLGYDLAAGGVGLLLASPGMLLISLPIMLVLQIRFLLREEVLLERRFPKAWRDYRARVPLLVPRPFRQRGAP